MKQDQKQCIVVFTRNNARIYYIEDVSKLGNLVNVIINPDLSYVDGVAPHFWKMDAGVIVPMTDEERERRLRDIELVGVDNDPSQKQQLLAHEKKMIEKLEQERELKRQEQKKVNDLLGHAHYIKKLLWGSYLLSVCLAIITFVVFFKRTHG